MRNTGIGRPSHVCGAVLVGSWQRSSVVGSLPARTERIRTTPIVSGLVTLIVSSLPGRTFAALTVLSSVTFATSRVTCCVLDLKVPQLPEHVTLIVDPAFAVFTASVRNRVYVRKDLKLVPIVEPIGG